MKSLIQSIANQVRLENDPSRLDGTPIIFISYNLKYDDAFVALCEYDIGITIQRPDGMKLVCIDKKLYQGDAKRYNETFWYTVRAIQDGVYDLSDKKSKGIGFESGSGFLSCAFGG